MWPVIAFFLILALVKKIGESWEGTALSSICAQGKGLVTTVAQDAVSHSSSEIGSPPNHGFAPVTPRSLSPWLLYRYVSFRSHRLIVACEALRGKGL